MFSKILIKLVDEAILPAILLIVCRIVSVVLVSRYLAIGFDLTASGFTFQSPKDYVVINSYSTLAMICVLTFGLFYVLLKSLAFHDTHITPKLTAKIFSLRLQSFMQSSFELYSQGSIWLSYSYLFLFCSGIMAYLGMIFPWIFFLSLAVTVGASYLFVLDIESEVFSGRSRKSAVEEEIVLKLGDLDEL